MNEKKIPNLNTISTFIDRWIIEHVKLSIFEERLTNLDHLKNIKTILETGTPEQALNFIDVVRRESEQVLPKIATQSEIISCLKAEFEEVLNEIFSKKSYKYISEERTFKL